MTKTNALLTRLEMLATRVCPIHVDSNDDEYAKEYACGYEDAYQVMQEFLAECIYIYNHGEE